MNHGNKNLFKMAGDINYKIKAYYVHKIKIYKQCDH